jgi:probable rRNA maturation factor
MKPRSSPRGGAASTSRLSSPVVRPRPGAPSLLNCQRRVRISPVRLGRFLGRVSRTVGARPDAFAVCLLSDVAMARLNLRYRGKRGPTDVLSFPAIRVERREKKDRKERRERIQKNQRQLRASSSSSFTSSPSSISFPSARHFLGDIAISPETALRQARRDGRPLEQELRVLILHGVLHLLGFDHETDDGEMERFESRLRHRLGLD